MWREDGEAIRSLERFWLRNFDAILDDIQQLRAGKPTAIRLVNAANPFAHNPGMDKGLPKGFALGPGADIFQALTDAVCRAARTHHVKCIDVRPIINGPDDQGYADEDSSKTMRAVADALLATGLPGLV